MPVFTDNKLFWTVMTISIRTLYKKAKANLRRDPLKSKERTLGIKQEKPRPLSGRPVDSAAVPAGTQAIWPALSSNV